MTCTANSRVPSGEIFGRFVSCIRPSTRTAGDAPALITRSEAFCFMASSRRSWIFNIDFLLRYISPLDYHLLTLVGRTRYRRITGKVMDDLQIPSSASIILFQARFLTYETASFAFVAIAHTRF